MTSLKRLKPALRSPWLPLALLLIALSTVFIFAGDRGYFYRPGVDHNWLSAHHLSIAVNLSPEHGFQRFERRTIDDEGVTGFRWPFNRFPPGGYISMKLAAMPFGGSPSAQLYAVRILMLVLFTAAAVLAYLSLCRLTSNRWIALTATLLSFSSYYLLYYNDMTANEGMLDFFGVMVTFHGMVVFVQEGRFRQLLVKTCIALLLGWHVLALVAPFVIFGLARDFLQARSADAASPPPAVLSSELAASALLRRRYLLLGAVALGFGLCVLTFNFAMEYAAFDGETPLTELPSFQSMLTHTGIDQGIIQALWTWGRFLDEQFSRISHMFIPYALLGGSDAVEGPTRISEFQGVVLGILLSTACLIGSIFVRPRILFATLASFGFFWALPMYRTTEFNDFESIYYIGLPLVFFTLALLWVRMLTKRDGVIAAASVIALLIFAVSSFQMSRVGYSAETAQAARGAEQDLSVIRELTAGELVTILRIGGIYKEFIAWRGYAEHAIHYYLNSHPIRYEYLPAVEGGFVIMRERIDTPALLTPQNQHFFLYDRDSLEAWYEATYRTAASTDPLAREDFDVYFDDRTVYYLKEPCERADVNARFFLHVYPVDENDLPEDRRQQGYDDLNFVVFKHGLLFDGKCLARFVLPQYAISRIKTGRVGEAWNAVHYLHLPKLISETQSLASNEPDVRAEFDIYLDGGKVYYYREPCVRADTAARFFLHVYPIDENDLPEGRRQVGYDNLDFDFDAHGALFDDECAAAVPLPQYDITRIDTGQFDSAERIWNATHYLNPPELILETQSIASNEPAARAEFDIYLDGGKLYYYREPCVRADTAARFFLHVYPIDENDLPEGRRQVGYDNLDFDFDAHGALFDDECAAAVPLPQYDITRIDTGQFDSAERIWNATHYLNPPELILETQSIASNEPAARAEFDIYLDGGKLYYYREPCVLADTAARFFLHVYPIDENDLPEGRRQVGYDNLDFDFDAHGALFDDKCAAAVPLPQYDIARIDTGQFDSAERIWEVGFPPIPSNEPAARSKFDIYLDGGKLYYYREPCVLMDTAARFFLHVYPIDENDLPDDRRQKGYDNLDFDFGEHGVLFDDECAAAVPLPQYIIARIDTGQFDSAERIWEVGFPPIASNEPVARSEFDMYIDGGKLYYFREPCVRADTAARFFLHVYPIDENDLSEDRWQRGYDNLDFDFGTRGVLFDDECVAAVPLPQYDIARIDTGQFDGTGRIWEVGFPPSRE